MCPRGGAFQLHAARVIFTDPDPEQRGRAPKAALGWLPIAGYLASGVALVIGRPSGLVLAAAACLLAIVVSWVVLVEVLR